MRKQVMPVLEIGKVYKVRFKDVKANSKNKKADEGVFENDYWDYARICFDKDCYTYGIVWKDEGIIESITNCSDYAIAGNIYEDKELLDRVKE